MFQGPTVCLLIEAIKEIFMVAYRYEHHSDYLFFNTALQDISPFEIIKIKHLVFRLLKILNYVQKSFNV